MRILFYGDSNTWGYDSIDHTRIEKRYTQLLRMRHPEDEIIEEGLCGRTLCLDDPYDRDRNGAKGISMVIKSHLPLDLVVVMLGTNDAKRQYATNPISLEKGIRTLLYAATAPEIYRDLKQYPKFLVVCPPKMNPIYVERERTLYNFGKMGYDILENGYENLIAGCKDFDCKVIDPGLVANPIDGIHLDRAGHEKLADYLDKEIWSVI